MKVISRKCNVGHNGERFVKGTPFDVDDITGNRLISQGTVELVGTPSIIKTPRIEIPAVIIHAEKPAEEEFKKVGGRWRKSKPKEQLP